MCKLNKIKPVLNHTAFQFKFAQNKFNEFKYMNNETGTLI